MERVEIEHQLETAIDRRTERALASLLDQCFPGMFEGRTYYKQLPHARLLLRGKGVLVGQCGLDFRIIRIGDEVLRALGVIDLCVAHSRRRLGLASELLDRVDEIAKTARADLTLLFADRPGLYRRAGFQAADPARVQWLAVENIASDGMVERDLAPTLMVRMAEPKQLPSGIIDLIGYLY